MAGIIYIYNVNEFMSNTKGRCFAGDLWHSSAKEILSEELIELIIPFYPCSHNAEKVDEDFASLLKSLGLVGGDLYSDGDLIYERICVEDFVTRLVSRLASIMTADPWPKRLITAVEGMEQASMTLPKSEAKQCCLTLGFPTLMTGVFSHKIYTTQIHS
ncbi:MAG TPA: hypothetical protein DDW17_06545 [Deltaproteobacteria bacterium]|nr:hypothetical protein [Deltaproteobacteria bacterium]